jgi:Ca2+-binding EF-hand superfamily protein
MKPLTPFQLALAAVLLPALAFAAKAGKPDKKKAAPDSAPAVSDVIKSYDKNGNRQIDSDELPALQKTFAEFRKLDKNGNGEIEPSEVEPPKKMAATGGDRRSRAMAGLKKVDKNGNGKIDTEEAEGLQKVLAGSKILEKLDRNGNGKLEPNELERVNQRMAQGGFTARSPEGKPATKTTPPPSTSIEPAKNSGDPAKFEAKKEGEPKKENDAAKEKDAQKDLKQDPFLPKADGKA